MLAKVWVFACAGLFACGIYAFDDKSAFDNKSLFGSENLNKIMQRIEANADRFDDAFESALDKSSLNGSALEDQLNHWADFLEDEVDNLQEDYKEKDNDEFIVHLENSMIVADGINRVMLRRDFSENAQSEWEALRQDLNQVAIEFRRPVLANVVVTAFVPATSAMLGKADVKQVMESLEASTDRFEKKFREALHHSTVATTPRADLYAGWADLLEDVSDDMLDEYRENDAKEFQEELENTLMISAAMNRLVLGSTMTPDAAAEWSNVRQQLNTLASTFGYPLLPDTVASVRVISSR
jgi:hypothetical protein